MWNTKVIVRGCKDMPRVEQIDQLGNNIGKGRKINITLLYLDKRGLQLPSRKINFLIIIIKHYEL